MVLQFLWIPSLVLVGLFILALCFYFYSEYDCCICKRRVPKRASLPNETELETVVSLKDDWKSQRYAPASSPTPVETLAAPVADEEVIQCRFGERAASEVFGVENGMPTLDLHGMTAEEARELTRCFLRTHSRSGNLATGGAFMPGTLAVRPSTSDGGSGGATTVKIITGRGLHSQGGIPIVKPVVENILRQRNLKYTIIGKGGAFTVQL